MEKKLQSRKVIKCPHCGWEYLPGEIFYPDYVIGQPVDIVRDALGHIIYEGYKNDTEPEAEEKFVCDHCDKPFIVEVDIDYRSKEECEELDFSETSVNLF